MTFYHTGIRYKNTSRRQRDEAYRRRADVRRFFAVFYPEAAVIFTCNRVEVYGIARDEADAVGMIDTFSRVFPVIFEGAFTTVNTADTLMHALRVASGLDSRILGEAEIFEQLRIWIHRDDFPPELRSVWESVCDEAQRIREASGLSGHCYDLSDLVYTDLQNTHASSEKMQLLVIGTGKVARLFAKNTPARRHALTFAARKKKECAYALAQRSGGKLISMEDVGVELLKIDALISATSSPHTILTRHYLQPILARRNRTLRIYDLAVPPDVEEGVRETGGLILKNADDLVVLCETENQHVFPYAQKAVAYLPAAVGKLEERMERYAFKSRDTAECVGFETGR